MPTYKLTYFDAKGRCETIRLVFAAAGVKFEDNRIEFKDWPALKPKTPWGSLPLLEVDGSKQVGQSITIARYMARQTGLAGGNNYEQAAVDAFCDVITDIREAGIHAIFEKDEEKKKEMMLTFQEKTLPDNLETLNSNLERNKHSGVFVGKEITWADLHFYAVAEVILPINPDMFSKFPKLKNVFDNVAKNKRIDKYLKNRKPTAL